MCGHVFVVPTQRARPASSPSAAPNRGPIADLLDESLGTSAGSLDLATAALDSPGFQGVGLSTYRRRRMSASDLALLIVGASLAALGFVCLSTLYRLLEATAVGWMVAAIVLMLLGAGLVCFAQRRNLLVALPAGTAICCLALVGYMIRPLPKSPEQLAEECLRAGEEFVTVMESIHDEETLRQARPKALDAVRKIVESMEQGKRLAAEGQNVSPAAEEKLIAAASSFFSRSAAAGRRLRDIPGGRELALDIAQVFSDGQKRIAAIPSSKQTFGARSPEPLSPQRRDELRDVGVSFYAYLDQHRGQAPRKWEDFEQFLQTKPRTLAVLRKLRAEGWVIHWGVDISKCTIGTSNFILAHGKDAPEKGGPMLYMDGACASLPAEEIRQRLNAQASLEPPEQRLTFAAPSQVASAAPAVSEPPETVTPPLKTSVPPPTTDPYDGLSASDANSPLPEMPTGGFDVGPSAASESVAPTSPAKPSDASPSSSAPKTKEKESPDTGRPRPPGLPRPGSPVVGGPPFPGMPGPLGDVGRQSETIGGQGGAAFLKVRPGQAMVGLAWTMGTWAGRTPIGRIEPLFDRAAPAGRSSSIPGPGRSATSLQRVLAKDGYAIGGLTVDADQYVDAVQPIFMKLRPDGKLDPADRYQGPWLGEPRGKNPRTIDGNGVKVIGIHGRGTAVLDAVGLVFEQ